MTPEAATLIALAFLFGLATGSFLNVCIYRLPLDLKPWRPARSFCPACEAPIAWFDNLPVISFLLLGGRCRQCHARISIRYPLVELATALLFAFVIWRWGVSIESLKWALLGCLLIVLFWIDLTERFLPDEITLGGALAGLILSAFLPPVSFMAGLLPWEGPAQRVATALLSGLSLALPFWLLGWLYAKLRQREGLGFGDVKLLLMIGVFFGLEEGVRVLLAACLAGAIGGLVYLRIRKLDAASYGLPLGSFIATSAFLALLGAY